MKKLIAFVLAALLAFLLLPASVFAEGEYPYEAPKLSVLTQAQDFGDRRFKEGDIVMKNIPDALPEYTVTITNKANGELYEEYIDGFGGDKPVAERLYFGYQCGEVMQTGIYTFSVYFRDDNGKQASPVAEVDYDYTYPGEQYGTPTDAAWTEDGDFSWTLPSGLNGENLFVRYGKVQENGEIRIINHCSGPADDTTRFRERFIERVNRFGEGDYCFAVRVLSNDVAKCFHSAWSEWSETRHIDPVGDGLKDSIENIATGDKSAAVEAVRNLNTNDLSSSMAADNEGTGVVSALAELEKTLGLAATVVKTADADVDIDPAKVTIVGAGFNSKDKATKPTLTISKVSEELEIPNDGYVNNNLVQFDLSLGDNVDKNPDGSLLVPVRITMPVPEGINPQYLRILHFGGDGSYDKEIRPYVYQDGGVWMASFVVTHLSPFVFIEAAQGGGDDTGFTVTFNANGGTALTPATATTTAGKLASLPTPTRSGYTFAGWFTAADGGESVTTDTLFSADTTIYAHWTRNSSGGSGSSGGYTPAKPATPTKPEKPTTPSVPVTDASEKFSDVAKDAWYIQDVSYAVSHGLMNGTGGGSFEPNTPLSRAMLAQILYNYQGNPAVSAAAGFTDVSGGWYADAVSWAASKGVVQGNSDGSFNPNGAITREQVAVMLYRFAQSLGIDVSARGDLSAFADSASVSNYAAEAMAWATASGLINGSDGRLDPAGSATRAQAAAILHRFCENVIK